MFKTGRRPNLSQESGVQAQPRSDTVAATEKGEGRLWRSIAFLTPTARATGLSHPDDPAEREADRIAESALSTSGPWTAPMVPAAAGDAGLVRRRRHAAPQQPAAFTGPLGPLGPLGPGQPLRPDLAAYLEPRLGGDLSGVRIHTDEVGARLARSIDADAFTTGSHVVFGSGQYSSDSSQGRRLLAHELAHVVQQRSTPGSAVVHRKAMATRFSEEPTLDDISEGKKVLKEGDKGESVIRVTTALYDLGHYSITVIDESFDPPLTSAVMKFQTVMGLSGSVPAGVVEKQTFAALDSKFAGSFTVERDVLGRQKSADIDKQTQSLDPAERAASRKAISTAPRVDPITGLPPKFVPDIPLKGKFADRLRAVVETVILAEYDAMGKGKAAAHADPAKLYSWGTVDAIAVKAQAAVNGRFKEYLVGRPTSPLKHGVSIFDAWSDKVAALAAGGVAAEDDAASWRVKKILDMDEKVKKLDDEHGADHDRSAEKAIVGLIHADMMAKHRAKLIETHKGWPGYEDGDKIFIQRFKSATADEQRYERWHFFQTFIHEYLHSLEHHDHLMYRNSLSSIAGGGTLREGTTDYFTKLVWSGVVLDAPLRKAIEGPVHDPGKNFAVQPLNTYPEAINAERLVGVVGIRNVAAAFFLGKVELIGKP